MKGEKNSNDIDHVSCDMIFRYQIRCDT